MVLGDNIFYETDSENSRNAAKDAQEGQATVFGYYVNDPERFGVVDFRCERKSGIHRGKTGTAKEQL